MAVKSPRSLIPMTVRFTQKDWVDLRQCNVSPLSLTPLSRKREIALVRDQQVPGRDEAGLVGGEQAALLVLAVGEGGS